MPARGRTTQEILDCCVAPPENIVELQQAAVELVERMARWLRELSGAAKT